MPDRPRTRYCNSISAGGARSARLNPPAARPQAGRGSGRAGPWRCGRRLLAFPAQKPRSRLIRHTAPRVPDVAACVDGLNLGRRPVASGQAQVRGCWIAFAGSHRRTTALATPPDDARPARQQVSRLVEPPDRRLAATERLAVLCLQLHDRSSNPTDPAALRVPAVFHPHREVKLAEVLCVEGTDAHEGASLNSAEVLQARALLRKSCRSPFVCLAPKGPEPVSRASQVETHLVGRSRPAFRPTASGTSMFPLPHQVRTEFDELSVIRADVVGVETLPAIENQAIAHALQCFVNSGACG